MHQIIYTTQTGLTFPAMPAVVCIKGIDDLSDHDLLQKVGLCNIEASDKSIAGDIRSEIYVCQHMNWTLLIDNWGYTYYHFVLHQRMNGLADVDRFAKQYDVFEAVFGDSDDSFSFRFCKNGKLARELEVTDPHYKGAKIHRSIGAPLPGEAKHFDLTKDYETIINIAAELGIFFPAELAKYKQYNFSLPE